MAYYDIWYMREVVSDMYPSDSWKQKVSRMGDNQILALFYKHLKASEDYNRTVSDACLGTEFLEKKLNIPSETTVESDADEEFVPEQLSFF